MLTEWTPQSVQIQDSTVIYFTGTLFLIASLLLFSVPGASVVTVLFRPLQAPPRPPPETPSARQGAGGPRGPRGPLGALLLIA